MPAEVSGSINSEEGREMRAAYQFELYLRDDFYCCWVYLSVWALWDQGLLRSC